MIKGILGKKLGMTQVFADDGRRIPVTVVEAGPCTVVQKKTVASDGYSALQLGFGAKNRAPRQQAGDGPLQEGWAGRLSAPAGTARRERR